MGSDYNGNLSLSCPELIAIFVSNIDIIYLIFISDRIFKTSLV